MSSKSSLSKKQTLEQFLQKNELFKQKMFGIERWLYPRIPQDICRLTVKYSKEQTQDILEEAEKGNFLVFSKVRLPRSMNELFIALTSAEVTVVRNNSPGRTNVIYGGSEPFYVNIFELWVSKNTAEKFLFKKREKEVIFSSQTKNPTSNSKLEQITYRKDDISNVTIKYILPKFLPNKSNELDKKQYWNCFCELKDALIKDGAHKVEIYIEKNKDQSSIVGINIKEDPIDITYKTFRARLSNLVKAYKNNS